MARDFMDQIKSMDKRERSALLEKVLGALTSEQQAQISAIAKDKKQMSKLQEGLNGGDFDQLVEGLRTHEDPRDFLNSPRVQKRLKELLD